MSRNMWTSNLTRNGLDNGVRFPAGLLPLPPRPDRLNGPPSLLPNRQRRKLTRRQGGWSLRMTSKFHLVHSRKFSMIYMRQKLEASRKFECK